MALVPNTYEEWKRCITVDCGIQLTRNFIKERIAALVDMGEFHIQKFIESWGPEQHARTLAWFRRAAEELGSA